MMGRCVEERIDRVCRTILAGPLKSQHFLVVLRLQIMTEAVVSPCMPIFILAPLPMTPVATGTQMAG
jgi:hypothetical protein